MKDNYIVVNENGEEKEYKILMIIEKDYFYVIYTDNNNNKIDEDLSVCKVRSIENVNETLPITDDEWIMIESEYKKIKNIDINK